MRRTHLTLLLLVILIVPTAAPPALAQDEAPPDASPFQRRDAPSGDVLAQLNFGGAVRGDVGLDCVFNPSLALTSTPVCTLEVAEDADLALQGFAPNEL